MFLPEGWVAKESIELQSRDVCECEHLRRILDPILNTQEYVEQGADFFHKSFRGYHEFGLFLLHVCADDLSEPGDHAADNDQDPYDMPDAACRKQLPPE